MTRILVEVQADDIAAVRDFIRRSGGLPDEDTHEAAAIFLTRRLGGRSEPAVGAGPRAPDLAMLCQIAVQELENARPFVIQYGAEYEIARLDKALDDLQARFVAAPKLVTTQADGESGLVARRALVEIASRRDHTIHGLPGTAASQLAYNNCADIADAALREMGP